MEHPNQSIRRSFQETTNSIIMATTKTTKTRSTSKKATTKKKVGRKLIAFSPNKKLNAVLNEIHKDLLHISDTRAESIREVKRYKKEFPREKDYNLVSYGNLIISYYDVRDMYKRAGVVSMSKMSNDQIWDTYRRQVGWVVRNSPEFK